MRFLIFALTLFSFAAFAAEDYPLKLETRRDTEGFRVIAQNGGAAPVSVKAMLSEGKLVVATPAFPLVTVIPPHSGPMQLARIRGTKPGVRYSFHLEYRWAIGDYTASPRPDAPYRLPFEDGLSFRIGQAPGGPITTHSSPENRQAIDIPMPEGTPLVAAREGVVVYTQTSQLYGAQNPELLSRANEIRILHEDGAITTYAHLAPNGVLVQPGQRVSTGTRIGFAGSTGYSSGPHLHFAVHKLVQTADGFAIVSLPILFHVGNPAVLFAPRHGMIVSADYQHPGMPPRLQADGLQRIQPSSAGISNPGPRTPQAASASQWQSD